MVTIRDQISARLRQADTFVCLPQVFGFSLFQLGQDLVASIEDDGYVPYVLGQRSRFRSTPLASCLYYLWSAGLLPPEATRAMRESLFKIRDQMPPLETRPPRAKAREDSPAWCVSEGASVWSTSMALIALLDSRLEPNRKQDKTLVDAVGWLIRQQDKDSGGWPFQQTPSSKPTVPMTSLALRSLARASALSDMNQRVRPALDASIQSGIAYLKSTLVRQERRAYWCFDEEPSLTATVWALESFRLNSSYLAHDLPEAHILKFVMEQIPSSGAEWKSECFVKEPQTKYAHQKTFYTFMPSLLPPLFYHGLSPIAPQVARIMQQLILAGRDKWRIKEYNMQPCTFTHAMAIYTLLRWCTHTQGVLVAGFFSPRQVKARPASACPVYEAAREKCPARGALRRARGYLALAFVSVLCALVATASGRTASAKVLSVISKSWDSPWFLTLVGGTIASLLAAAIWHFSQQRRAK